MYNLINDIEAYSSFIPWCTEASILFQDDDEIRATIRFSKRGISASFTTCNRLQKHKMIEMGLLEGPFRHLKGFWRFQEIGAQASKVSLDMEFELANKLLGLTFGPVFNQITNALVDAFVKRARIVYGKR